MVRIIAQVILSAAGVIVAFFVLRDEANYPVYQMAVSLLMLVIAALLVWYVPKIMKRD
ncbi:hypothetical protein [Brucella anthropi]|uniref:hypothetical protein n=1 Tax=Brucella anthropi TaxID=529 RepID=UPI0021666F2C|nr:hypothetical protein [Brucella anthropi]UVV70936.1 hypothetical protein NW321_24165 [Brucella anthropi]